MKILKIYTKKLRNKNYSERTISTYVCYLEKFSIKENISDAYQVRLNQIASYLENKTYSSASQQNQIIDSLKLFAKYILGKKDIYLNKIERPGKEKKLPQVIDCNFTKERLIKIENINNITF